MTSHGFIAALRGEAGLLRPGPRVLAPETVDGVHRARLLAGVAEAAATKGYAATTVADIVGRAQVSRRTFYEHFADKDACFLAAYDRCADMLIGLIGQTVETSDAPWHERVELGVSAYLHAMAGEPALTRVFLVDILAAGPQAIARRRAAHRRFAELLLELVERHRDELPAGVSLDPAMANAIIGGVNELVLLAVEDDRAGELPRLADTAARLVRAVLAPAPTAAPSG